MQSLAVADHLGDNMVIQRIGSKSIDVIEYEELKKLASQGISDEEIGSVVADYEEQEKQINVTFEVKREEYKRERAQENFKSGSGSFRRG